MCWFGYWDIFTDNIQAVETCLRLDVGLGGPHKSEGVNQKQEVPPKHSEYLEYNTESKSRTEEENDPDNNLGFLTSFKSMILIFSSSDFRAEQTELS